MQEISFRTDILPLKDKLFRLALRITASQEEAEDIVQETLIRVWNRREEWQEMDSIEAYCLTVAKNLAIDRCERMRLRNVGIPSELDYPSASTGPHDKLVMKDYVALARQLMNELPEKQRLIIHLREIEGKSYKEIAALLEVSEEQVKVNLFRARQKVKERFLEIDRYGV